MKFSCEKAILQEAVFACARAVSSKSSIPVLEGVMIEANYNSVRINGFNLSLSIMRDIPATVYEQGVVVINARMLCDIVRKLPDDMVLFECPPDHQVKISCSIILFNKPLQIYPLYQSCPLLSKL